MALWLQWKKKTHRIKNEYYNCKSLYSRKVQIPLSNQERKRTSQQFPSCWLSGWVLCNFIHHSHLSPLSLLDTLGHTLCFQVLRFFLGNWGSPGTCPWNFSLLTIVLPGSHRAPSPTLCWELPFLLIGYGGKVIARQSPLAFSTLSAVLLFLTHTSAMCLSLVHLATIWTCPRPKPGLVERLTASRFRLQHSKPTGMGNHSDKKQSRAKPAIWTIFFQASSSSSSAVHFHLALPESQLWTIVEIKTHAGAHTYK